MSMKIEIQNVSGFDSLPKDEFIIKWAEQALDEKHKEAEITLRIVEEEEGQTLNKEWRGKDSATNVLSFPVGEVIEQAPNLLGDIVICAPIVELEAKQQRKNSEAHWAHLIIHGILHLQGYDHISDEDANVMETKEVNILKNIGFANPYETESE
ncbi:MAG TPA: rRNA maturation RNase YbeY [Thiotrichaceae bacterium]|jgi:probable rRNA maturation factor|nr:rRNA maturation RNase YbeY [Thiotrichaceae bacterium]HIM07384.1 rRNA maturation RNase YbeY [Gammaproteobacteria bacterium]